jgi:hypothetical protein
MLTKDINSLLIVKVALKAFTFGSIVMRRAGKTYPVDLTKAEIRALLDAAAQMSDDFEDYYSFLGPKRVKKHVENYNSGMSKLKNKL